MSSRPQVFRISLRINPILIILALLIGDQLYGIAGALVALPVIAVIRQTVLYLRRHLVLEPWGVVAAGGRRARAARVRTPSPITARTAARAPPATTPSAAPAARRWSPACAAPGSGPPAAPNH